MDFALNYAWAATAALLWVRLAALFFLTPVFSTMKVPPSITALILLMLSGVLASSPGVQAYLPATPAAFVVAALAECVTGAVMGFALQCVFAAASMAGQVLDMQLGFSIGAIFDPVTRARSPVLGTVFSLLAASIFFGLDAHLTMIQGLQFAAVQIPAGKPWLFESPQWLIAIFGSVFTLAVVLIAPVLVLMLLLEVALAVISRSLPQFNIFFVSLPIKTLSGLVGLALTIHSMPALLSQGFGRAFQFWNGVLR